MMLRVTDLMIDAAVKKKPYKGHPNRRKKTPKPPKTGWPKTCLPHTSPQCRTCTTVTNVSTHFTTGNTCLGSFDESSVRAELLAQLRSTLRESQARKELLENAA